MVTVNNASELTTELNNATGGEVIDLAAGVNFGRFTTPAGKVYSSPVTIQSLDPLNHAVFELLVLNSDNLTLKNFTIDYVYQSGDFAHTAALYSGGRQNITVDGLRVIGEQLNGGIPTGWGMDFRGSTNSANLNLVVRNCYIKSFVLGIEVFSGTNILLENIEFDTPNGDCVNPIGVKGITIRRIYAHDWGSSDPNAHLDFIQLLRSTFTGGCENVLVEYCVCDQGGGGPQQGFWAGGDGKDLSNDFNRHKNVTIRNSILIIGHLNGIAISGVDGYTVENTMLLAGPFSLRDTVTGGVPLADMGQSTTGVTFRRNLFMGYVNAPPGGSVVADNYQLTRSDIGGPNMPVPNIGDVDGFNDYQIANGAYESGGVQAGPLIANRIGGWTAGGVAPHAAYQALPAGFQGAVTLPVLPAGSVAATVTVP